MYSRLSEQLRKTTTGNSTLAIGGVSSPFDSFVVAESSVLRTNFCAEKPAHRQSAKRYRLWYDQQTTEFSNGIFIIFMHNLADFIADF